VRYGAPFAGEGDLIKHLEGHAHCVWASDIRPQEDHRIFQADAFEVDIGDVEEIIDNPPWTRKILHKAIIHFSDQVPCWFLFDAAWAFTKQAGPFMNRCRKIVATPRLKWMPGTKWTGKDDSAWYRFDRPIPNSAPILYGINCLPPEANKKAARICYDCGVMIDRHGKWRLEKRNGAPTPVHLYCDNPSQRYPKGHVATLAPIPLFDWSENSDG